jgi:hypothetical protein
VARKSDGRQRPHDANLGGEAHQGAEPASDGRRGRDGGRVLRVLALIAVAVGLAGLTAAACVLSYSSIHHLAIQAGVRGRLASIYPLIFDALLVVAGCSVLALRGAGLVSRVYSWLCMLVLLAALAAGGAARAAAVTIPHKTAAVVAAIVPWVLVLIGFGLLLALLRYARLRRLGRREDDQQGGGSGGDDATEPVAAGGLPAAERGAIPQDALIPGLAPKPHAIVAPRERSAATNTAASRVKDGPGQVGKNAEAAGAAAAAAAAGVAAAAGAAAAEADASSGGSGVEPPTVPGAAVPAQHASPADDRATDQPAAPAAAPTVSAASLPAAAAILGTGTAAELRPGVRRADLQWRARIPKQPAPDPAGAHQAPPGRPAPFMPKVGQQGAAAGEQAGPGQQVTAGEHGPEGSHDAAPHDAAQRDAAQRDAAEHDEVPRAGAALPTEPTGSASPTALPKRVPGQQPVTSGLHPAPAGPTKPRLASDDLASGRTAPPADAASATPATAATDADADADVAADARAGEPAAWRTAGPTQASTLNPAPTHHDDAEEAHGLPAFLRTRSTPTPPQGDEPHGGEPQRDEPQRDEPQGDAPLGDQRQEDEPR